MVSRTANFEGARLKEAREARGLTAVSLAEQIGKTPQAISKFEKNETSPSPLVLEAIAHTLNIPISFFTLPPRKERSSTIFFRSMSAATKRARTRANCKLEWLEDITIYLSKFVEFPVPNLPNLILPEDPMLISDDDIEYAAADARQYWQMNDMPIGNMVGLLEHQGVIIARHELEANSLDSLSTFGDDGRPYIIIGTDKGTSARWRFDVAHELGHLLLHSSLDKRKFATSEYHKKIEDQAHRFARAFLLPIEPFSEDLFALDIDVLLSIKPKWKVSIAAMIMRGCDINIVSEQFKTRLYINLSRRKWRREEPFDNEIKTEEPELLQRAIEMVLTNGAQTVDDIALNLSLSLSDIEGLVSLPNGYFSGSFARIQMIQHQTINEAFDPNRPPAEVINLPFRKKRK